MSKSNAKFDTKLGTYYIADLVVANHNPDKTFTIAKFPALNFCRLQVCATITATTRDSERTIYTVDDGTGFIECYHHNPRNNFRQQVEDEYKQAHSRAEGDEENIFKEAAKITTFATRKVMQDTMARKYSVGEIVHLLGRLVYYQGENVIFLDHIQVADFNYRNYYLDKLQFLYSNYYK